MSTVLKRKTFKDIFDAMEFGHKLKDQGITYWFETTKESNDVVIVWEDRHVDNDSDENGAS